MTRQENCQQCGKFAKVAKRTETGAAICPPCYYRDFYVWPTGICVMCGETAPVYKRNEKGQLICKRCYAPPKSRCVGCDRLTMVNQRSSAGDFCVSCYNKRHKTECGICERLRKPAATHDGIVFCTTCHRRWRYANDVKFRLTCQLRNRLGEAIRAYTKCGKQTVAKEYGVDYSAIIAHLEPFPERLSEFHIDHIFPLVAFDLNDLRQVAAAFAPENHRWLTKQVNLSKNDAYDEQAFRKYLTEHGCGEHHDGRRDQETD